MIQHRLTKSKNDSAESRRLQHGTTWVYTSLTFHWRFSFSLLKYKLDQTAEISTLEQIDTPVETINSIQLIKFRANCMNSSFICGVP